MKRFVSLLLALAMVLCSLAGFTSPVQAAAVNRQVYGGYTFTKVSNPETGSGQPDGINTNDLTGFSANRLNSYAWAVTSRGNNIYIGTNRTLFGSAANAVAETLRGQGIDLSDEMFGKLITIASGGDVPVNLNETDYIPQIIKFDTVSGTTEVIYQPKTTVGEDGRLYYTDKDGAIVPGADVSSETASFRSVIQFNGNMYFGSLGTNMLQLVRVDENDHADVVFQTVGLISSLRACAAHDDGDGETIYFGGQDTTYMTWRKYRMDHPGEAYPLPIVIRYLDPATAGTDHEDWSGLVADFRDFGQYSYATVYANGGGNVWDLCSYNGKLYLILAYDGGWAMFRGEKGGDAPNAFGWTWTEIVGLNGKYPLAMNSEVGELNEQYREAYNCLKYGKTLNNAGLLESTATPYVYKGKMYIGSFDNATAVQSQTISKVLAKLTALKNSSESGDTGPTLEQIFAPIYEVLAHPQHIWVMNEDETIEPVASANELLRGTTNDYVWRFIEYDGKLYTGTFDASTAYIYYLRNLKDRVRALLEKEKSTLSANLKALLDGTLSTKLRKLYEKAEPFITKTSNVVVKYIAAAMVAAAGLEAFLSGEEDEDQLYVEMAGLAAAQEAYEEKLAGDGESDPETSSAAGVLKKVKALAEWMLKAFDVKGLEYLTKARELATNAENGFDLFVTEDGEHWEKIVGNGCGDAYNYGARTFTICNDELYIGTANPYYGAQLWKVTEGIVKEAATVTKEPAAVTGKVYKAKAQNLVKPGKAQGGTMVYALGDDPEAVASEAWQTKVPCGTDAGEYSVCWKVLGDENHLDAPGGTIAVTIGKAKAKICLKNSAKTYTVKSVKKSEKTFSIGPSVNSKGDLSCETVKYYSKASKKYLTFDAESGKVTVQQGTPRGIYAVKVKVSAQSTDNYKAASLTKYIKVVVL